MGSKQQKGFTLIEAIVYFALFSLFLVGAILTAYQVLQGQGQAASLNTSEDEGGFVIRKIEWALNGVTTITTPSAATPYASSLDIISNGGDHITLSRSGTKIIMNESGTSYDLTTDNIKVSSLRFHYLAPSAGVVGIEVSTTINGEEFDTVRYIR